MLLMIMMDACISLYQQAFNFLQETKFKKKIQFLAHSHCKWNAPSLSVRTEALLLWL